MDKKSYRTLLPASEPPQQLQLQPSLSAPETETNRIGADVDSGSGRKRQRITRVACSACQKRKTACDGARPTCSACRSRYSACIYISQDESETRTMALKRQNEELSQKSKILEELVKYLQSMPEDDAQAVLRQLRAGSDPRSLLSSVKGGTGGYHAPAPTSSRAALMSVQPGIQPQSMLSHAVAHSAPSSSPSATAATLPTPQPYQPTAFLNSGDGTPSRSNSSGVLWGSGLPFASNTPVSGLGSPYQATTSAGPAMPQPGSQSAPDYFGSVMNLDWDNLDQFNWDDL